jgi:hypothetical protein
MLTLTPSWAAAGVNAAGKRMAAAASRVIAVRFIMTASCAARHQIRACWKYAFGPVRVPCRSRNSRTHSAAIWPWSISCQQQNHAAHDGENAADRGEDRRKARMAAPLTVC